MRDWVSLRQIQSATHCSLETIHRYINNPRRGLQEQSVKPRRCKMDRFETEVLIDLFHKSKGNFVVIARCLHHLAQLRKLENFKMTPVLSDVITKVTFLIWALLNLLRSIHSKWSRDNKLKSILLRLFFNLPDRINRLVFISLKPFTHGQESDMWDCVPTANKALGIYRS